MERDICDPSAQNQSNAKHKMAENCILSENVKKNAIFWFHQNNIFGARLFQNICIFWYSAGFFKYFWPI